MAMGRLIDEIIVDGMLGRNMTGRKGETLVELPKEHIIKPNLDSDKRTGLTVAKLLQAKTLFMKAKVNVSREQLFIAITADDHKSMLEETKAISLDYNDKPVLVNGSITSFMGFNFIHHEELPGCPDYDGDIKTPEGIRYLPCWVKRMVTLGVWDNLKTTINQRPDKCNDWQVHMEGTFGATRLDDKGVIRVECK